MRTKPTLLLLVAVGLFISGGMVVHFARKRPSKVIDPPNESDVEMTVVEAGTTYKLYHAGLYRVNAHSGKWEFQEQLYDPDFYAKNYVERDGVIYRKLGPKGLIPVKRHFSDDFENARTIRDLITPDRGWTEFMLPSPKAPSINDYVRLRQRILTGQSDFLDNRIEPTTEVVHSGKSALKAYSVAPAGGMTTAKANLTSELLHFVKGDDVWFSGWYYVPEGSAMPSVVMDLETSWLNKAPGMRIMIVGGKYAAFELKSFRRVIYSQAKGKEVSFPVAKWVHLRAHLKLSEKEDGIIELWQDGAKIVDARSQTLILPNAIYNFFVIGITAHSTRPKPATLYVDDVSISDRPSDSNR